MTFGAQQVLVTGAAGFIGNALALRLAQRGYAVRALVRKERVQSPAVRLLTDAGVTIVPGDVCDKRVVADAVRGCLHVYHLAAQKTVRGTSFSKYYDVNVQATRQLAEAASTAGVTRFVYGSTLGVHGFVAHGPLDEQSAVRPNTDYRRSKLLGEDVVRAMSVNGALPVVVARISTIVGPGARSWNPLIRGIAQRRFNLIGNGSNHIDLLAIEDIVDGLQRCAEVPSVEGRTYVLGSASPTTLRAFVDEIASAVGVPAPGNGPPLAAYQAALSLLAILYRATGIHFNGAHNREVLVANKIAVSTRAHAELGYAPLRPVKDAVKSMVHHYMANGGMEPGRQ